MKNTQNGLFIVCNGENVKDLSKGFTTTTTFPKHLSSHDIDYAYIATLQYNNHRLIDRGYYRGYIGLIKSISIFNKTEDNITYSFEFSQLLRPCPESAQLSVDISQWGHGDILEWDFVGIYEDVRTKKNPDEKVLNNPSQSNIRLLSINEAIEGLANSHGVSPEKITISITG